MQGKLPLVSIITPTYNREKLLEKAILSVINQKKDIPFEWEHLIIDDGSSDGTKELVQKYLNDYAHNIKYFYQENSGVGKARNVGLDNMSRNSDYVIFLDSDNEIIDDFIFTMLSRFENAKKDGDYDEIIGIGAYCKTDSGRLIGSRNVLEGGKEVEFTYKMYLENKIDWEICAIFKSSVYLENKNFRFPEDVVNEGILWSKIWKWVYKNGYKILFLNYVGEIYGTQNEFNRNKITKTISKDRFRKNAIGNERVLEIIREDLINFGCKKSYSNYLFRAGINWILCGEKQRGLDYLKLSLKSSFDLKVFIIFILSILSRRIVLAIYKIYIQYLQNLHLIFKGQHVR